MPTDPRLPPRDMADMDAAAFAGELLSGRLRWLFSILAIVSIGTLVWTFADSELEVWFPFHAAGVTLRWLIAVGTASWVLLAGVNWRSWLRWKRSH